METKEKNRKTIVSVVPAPEGTYCVGENKGKYNIERVWSFKHTNILSYDNKGFPYWESIVAPIFGDFNQGLIGLDAIDVKFVGTKPECEVQLRTIKCEGKLKELSKED